MLSTNRHKRAVISVRLISLFLAALLLAGCSKIATVKHTTPSFATVGSEAPELLAAEQELRKAQKFQKSEPTRALGGYLAAAQAASRQLERDPENIRARSLYNFVVARCLDVIEAAPLDPWNRSLTVPGPPVNMLSQPFAVRERIEIRPITISFQRMPLRSAGLISRNASRWKVSALRW